MHSAKLLSVAALATLALAQPLQHHAHNVQVPHIHKREADPAEVKVYVTKHVTKIVTADAAAATAVAAAAQGLESAPVDESVASAANNAGYSAPAPQVNSSPAPASPAPSSSAAAASSAPASTTVQTSAAPSSSGSSSGSSPSANGITYSPYSSNGGCKSKSDVASDLAQLQSYNVIRIYGTDCDQVENVLSALGDHQQVFLGVFDVGSISDNLATIKSAIESTGKSWDVVHTVSIGNELVNGGQASVSQVKGYTDQARGILRGYGYTGPVVAVDTFIAIINNPDLCDASDYIACNAHAFFDGGVTADQAGDWALLQIQRVWDACGGKKSVLISESGWPSKGDTNGKAVPGAANMKAAVSSLKDKIGNDVILFTAFNDLWKSPGYLNVEQYWGILDN